MRQEEGRINSQRFIYTYRIWPLKFFIVFILRNSKKYIPGGKYNGCSRMLQINPLEAIAIFTMLHIFSFTDVNARKNFACNNFGVSVESCRQVKL